MRHVFLSLLLLATVTAKGQSPFAPTKPTSISARFGITRINYLGYGSTGIIQRNPCETTYNDGDIDLRGSIADDQLFAEGDELGRQESSSYGWYEKTYDIDFSERNPCEDGSMMHWKNQGVMMVSPGGTGGEGLDPIRFNSLQQSETFPLGGIGIEHQYSSDPYRYAAEAVLGVLQVTPGFTELRHFLLNGREQGKSFRERFELRLAELRSLIVK